MMLEGPPYPGTCRPVTIGDRVVFDSRADGGLEVAADVIGILFRRAIDGPGIEVFAELLPDDGKAVTIPTGRLAWVPVAGTVTVPAELRARVARVDLSIDALLDEGGLDILYDLVQLIHGAADVGKPDPDAEPF